MTKRMMPIVSVAAIAAACPAAVRGPVRAEGPVDSEALLKEVNQKLENLNGEIKQTAEAALKQAKTAGEVSAETKAAADKMLSQQTDFQKTVQSLTDKLEGIDTKMLDVSQQVAGLGNGGGQRPLSLGQAVAAEDVIKNYGGSGEAKVTVSNTVTTAAGSGGGLIYNEEERDPVRLPRRRLRVRDLLTRATTSSNTIVFRKQVLRTDGAGMVAETVASGGSDFGWSKATELVKKIGTHTNISEETLADADQLQSEIDSELVYLIELEEEAQIIAGDGSPQNLTGLLTAAPNFVGAFF